MSRSNEFVISFQEGLSATQVKTIRSSTIKSQLDVIRFQEVVIDALNTHLEKNGIPGQIDNIE